VQLCTPLAPGSHADLRRELPGVEIIQVVHVTGESAVATAVAVAPEVDGILLDSGSPAGPCPQLGGTGRPHDWLLSRRIRQAVDVPVYLAGGLRAENVAAAIALVRPYGVDVCTGVRTANRLDAEKLGAFMAAVRTTR
jgi:phosphoribosylanthranilate isomerase